MERFFEVIPHPSEANRFTVRYVRKNRKFLWWNVDDLYRYLSAPTADSALHRITQKHLFTHDEVFGESYYLRSTPVTIQYAKRIVDAATERWIPDAYNERTVPTLYKSRSGINESEFDVERANELYHQLKDADAAGEPIDDILREMEKLHKNFDK